MSRVVYQHIGGTSGDAKPADDDTTADDRFASVHQLQYLARNFNAALAQQARQPAMAIAPTGWASVLGFGDGAVGDPGSMARVIDVAVPVPSWCQEFKLSVRAAANSVDCVVYPSDIVANSPRPRFGNSLTITGAAATYTATLQVGPAARAKRVGRFVLFVGSQDIDHNGSATHNVVEGGANWVRYDSASLYSNRVMLLSTGGVVYAAVLTGLASLDGAEATQYTVTPMTRVPVAGDSVEFVSPASATVTAVTLQPQRAEDFGPGGQLIL